VEKLVLIQINPTRSLLQPNNLYELHHRLLFGGKEERQLLAFFKKRKNYTHSKILKLLKVIILGRELLEVGSHKVTFTGESIVVRPYDIKQNGVIMHFSPPHSFACCVPFGCFED
jgi:hypothetical protein